MHKLSLDGCFIIEIFYKDDNEMLRDDDDPIFNMSCMLQYLYHDLILLENQIPWFVLEKLFNLTKEPGSKTLSELALQFFGCSMESSVWAFGSPLQRSKGQTFQAILSILMAPALGVSDDSSQHRVTGWPCGPPTAPSG